jgi:hypothetical protein
MYNRAVELQLYSLRHLGARWDVGGQCRTSVALLPGKSRYLLYRRLGGPRGRSGRVRKISPPRGFEPRTVHTVASYYTDCAVKSIKRESSLLDFLGSHVACPFFIQI